MMRAGNKVERDVLYLLWMLTCVLCEVCFELSFLNNSMNIVMLCNVADEIPPHTRF